MLARVALSARTPNSALPGMSRSAEIDSPGRHGPGGAAGRLLVDVGHDRVAERRPGDDAHLDIDDEQGGRGAVGAPASPPERSDERERVGRGRRRRWRCMVAGEDPPGRRSRGGKAEPPSPYPLPLRCAGGED